MSYDQDPAEESLPLDECIREIKDLKAKLSETERERDEAVALIDAAKSNVCHESFLGQAQAILAKCVAPYSCEQMKAVADAMAQWYRKWELMSEVAMKAIEDSDAVKAKLAALASYRIDHRLDCEFDPANAKACTCGLVDLVAAAESAAAIAAAKEAK